MMKRVFLPVLFFAAIAFSQAKNSAGLLPPSFSGWQIEQQSVKNSSDPAAIDQADAAVIKEYGFTGSEIATYTRNGRKMTVKTAQFIDASGAYGAFTYYLQPQMQVENIGDKGASNNSRILFYKGNLLVDVTLENITAMSAADLRALAQALPKPKSEIAKAPILPGNLPSQSLLQNTSRYIVGPEALTRLGVPIPAQLVDFSKSPELVFAKYKSSDGEAGLTLISYPTPQIARERMTAMQAASLPGGPFYFKRSGPYVAAINGSIPADEANSLLASVNYDADVTWNQPTKLNPRDNIGTLIVGIFVLIGALLLIALILGFAFGGARVIAKKIFPNRVFDKPEDVEIIQLNLK
jgi:hypothetical protein